MSILARSLPFLLEGLNPFFFSSDRDDACLPACAAAVAVAVAAVVLVVIPLVSAGPENVFARSLLLFDLVIVSIPSLLSFLLDLLELIDFGQIFNNDNNRSYL